MKTSKMAPPKVGGPRQFARVTRQTGKKKERIKNQKYHGGGGCYNVGD
jgi:hypothetical protein